MFQMSKIDDERTKLTATLLNGIALSMIVAGGVAPLIALSYDLPGSASAPVVALVGFCWTAAGVGFHLTARWILGRLTP